LESEVAQNFEVFAPDNPLQGQSFDGAIKVVWFTGATKGTGTVFKARPVAACFLATDILEPGFFSRRKGLCLTGIR